MLSDAALVLVHSVSVDSVGADTDDADASSILTRHVDEMQEGGTTGIWRFVSSNTVVTSTQLKKRPLCASADTVSPLT